MDKADLNPILVVDDDANDMFLFKRAAQKSRLANPILEAADGEAAIRYLQTVASDEGDGGTPPPIVVILDLKMPRKSGFEVLEWLQTQAGLRRVPVVVFTSSNQDPDISRAYDLGANSYLVKPVTFDALMEMVGSLGLYWGIHNQRPSLESADDGA